MHSLRPSLAIVEARLCGPSEAMLDRFRTDPGSLSEGLRAAIASDAATLERLGREEEASQAPTELSAAQPPDAPAPTMAQMLELNSLLDRREASRALGQVTEPAAGQIRLVERIVGPRGNSGYDLSSPLAVVLDEPVPDQPGIWSGWMASPDTDYASPWDLLLEGELADPMASMVQCWNSVLVYLKSTSLVIGQLSAERLAAVRALAAEHARAGASDSAPSEPGRRIERQVGGHAVLTGTPLAGEDADPRVRYQLLYHEAAEPLRICARDALGLIEEPVEPPDEAGVARWPRDAIAAIVDRLRERAATSALAFEEVPLVPTPASAEPADSARCIELAHLLRISLYGRSTGDEAVLHARLTPLTREPVVVEVLHGGVVTASETLCDAQPILDVPLSGAGAVLLRIVDPLRVDVPLPEIAG